MEEFFEGKKGLCGSYAVGKIFPPSRFTDCEDSGREFCASF